MSADQPHGGERDDDLLTTDTETSIEINFAVIKFKHLVKKKKKD